MTSRVGTPEIDFACSAERQVSSSHSSQNASPKPIIGLNANANSSLPIVSGVTVGSHAEAVIELALNLTSDTRS